jgi:chaperonin GroES
MSSDTQTIVGESATIDNAEVKIRPLGDRIVVLEADPETVRNSGLILPAGTELSRTNRGVIVAIGPGPRSPFTGEIVNMGLEVGMEVMFSTMTGTEVTMNGIPVVVLREQDIICVIEYLKSE